MSEPSERTKELLGNAGIAPKEERSVSARTKQLLESAQVALTPEDPNLPDFPGEPITPPEERVQEFGRTERGAMARIGGAFTAPFQDTEFGLPQSAADYFHGPSRSLNALNDVLVKGVASPVFTLLQGMSAGAEGAIDAMAQVGVEAGVFDAESGARFARDMNGMLEIIPAYAGNLPYVSGGPGAARLATQGVPTKAPELVHEARSLRVPVPVTRGDATGNIEVQAIEDEALKGLKGQKAKAKIESIRGEQDDAFRANIEEVQKDITGRPVAAVQQETGLGAEATGLAIKAEAKARRAQIRKAYEEANEYDTQIEAPLVRAFGAQQRSELVDDAFDLPELPRVSKRLDELEAFDETTSVSELEKFRKKLGRDWKSASRTDPTEAEALRRVKSNLDSYMSDLLDARLIQGDEGALIAMQRARDLRADFGRKFNDSKVITKIMDEDLSQEQTLNLIFGGSQMGFKTDAGKIVQQIKSVVGEDSGAFKSLKEEAVLRLVKNQDGPFSGVKFEKAYQKAMRDNPTLMRQLFTPEEIQDLAQIARVARTITEKKPGAVNHSASFIAYQRSKQRFRDKIKSGVRSVTKRTPFAGDYIEGIWVAADERTAAKQIMDYSEMADDVSRFRKEPDLLIDALETALLLPEREAS